jgi:hypothetical protein
VIKTVEASRIIPLTAMSKNPRYECIDAFSLRFLPIQVLRGADMGVNYLV